MVKTEITIKDIKTAFDRLSINQRIRLVEEFERKTMKQRLQQLYNRIDARRKTNPVSKREVNQIIKEVRSELHANKRSH